MIVVIGRAEDAVVARLRILLAECECSACFIDERRGAEYGCKRTYDRGQRSWAWRIEGPDCVGSRRVTAVFMRRAPHGEADRGLAAAFARRLDRLLLDTRCRVVNRPTASTGNYAKAHQLLQLANAGFDVPHTCVTASPADAASFIADRQGRVLLKGLSSVRTTPEMVTPDHLLQLEAVRRCPVQLQELVEGVEYRVTVLAGRAWASAVHPLREPARDAHAVLPAAVVDKCIRFTAAQGLALGGFDLIVDSYGRCCCLELNPNPLVTHYEYDDSPSLSLAIRDDLIAYRHGPSDFFA